MYHDNHFIFLNQMLPFCFADADVCYNEYDKFEMNFLLMY